MERAKRRRHPLWLRIALGLMVAVLVLFAAAVALRFWITSDGGRAFILSQVDGRKVGPLGTLRLSGLKGDPLSAATLADIALVDDEGVWLRARDALIEWTPTALFAGDLEIRRINIRTIDVLRRPLLAMQQEDSGPAPDIGLRLDEISVGDLHLAEPVIGIDAQYRIDGAVARPRDGSGFARMVLAPVSGPEDAANIHAEWSAEGSLKASAALSGPPGGLAAALLQGPEGRPVSFIGEASGTIEAFAGKGALRFGEVEAASFSIARQGAAANLTARLDAGEWPLLAELDARAGGPLDLAASADLSDLEQALVKARLMTPAGVVEADAPYNFRTMTAPSELATRFEDVDLAAVAAPMAGRASGAGILSYSVANVAWRGEASVVNIAWPSGRAARVTAPVSVSFARSVLSWQTSGARIEGGRIDALPDLGPASYAASARGEVNLRSGMVEIHGSQVEGAPGSVAARGSYDIGGGAIDFQGSARLARLGDVSPLTGAAQGRWSVKAASLRAPIRISAELEGRGVSSDVETLANLVGPAPRVTLAGVVSNGRFAIESGALQAAGLRASMTGRVTDAGGISGRATGVLSRPLDLGGAEIAAARFTADIDGTVQAPTIALRLDDAAVNAAGIAVRDIGGTAEARLGQTVTGRFALTGQSDTGPFGASGQVASGEGEWRINTLAANLGALQFSSPRLTISDGEMAMTFTARGPLAGIAGLERGALTAGGTMRVGEDLVLDISGRLSDLRSAALRMSVISFDLDASDGRATLTASATGSLGAPLDLDVTATGAREGDDWAGEATLQGTVDELPVTTARPALWRYGADGWSLDAAFRALRGEIDVDLGATAEASTARVELQRVNLRGLSRLARITPIQGTVTGLATFSNPLDARATGEMRLSVADANPVGVTANPVSLDLQATLREGVLASRLTGSGQGFSLNAASTLPVTDGEGFAISADETRMMAAEFDLDGRAEQLWALFGPEDQSLRGHLTANLKAAGTLTRPMLEGGIDVTEGAYEHGETGLALRDITAKGVFDQNSARITGLSAHDGAGGRLTGDGQVAWNGSVHGGINFRADNLRALGRDDRLVVLTGDGAVQMGEENIEVTGNFTIAQARISIEQPASATIPTLPGLRRVNFPNREDDEATNGPAAAWARPVKLDVRVSGPRRIMVFGRGLDTEWGANLHITGPIADPVFAGTATMERGDLDLAGRRFQFGTGTITLDGPIRMARIDIAATRTTADITASVRITGTPVDPEFKLESSPALPQDEVLSRVLFGRSVTELSGFEAAQLAAGLAQLAGGQAGFDPVGLVRQATGLDRVTFGAEDGIATVSAGKYVAENVYLQVGAGGTGGVGAEVEWEPTDGVSIISSADGNGDTKIAVRWKKDY